MDEHLGAERLRQDGHGLDPPVRRRIRLKACVLQVLRPDAQDQRASNVVREAGAVPRRPVVDGEPVIAESHGQAAVVVPSSASTRLIDGEPMKPATNSLTGWS